MRQRSYTTAGPGVMPAGCERTKVYNRERDRYEWRYFATGDKLRRKAKEGKL